MLGSDKWLYALKLAAAIFIPVALVAECVPAAG